jgi:ketosteroid isomerase-like protein
MTSETGHPSFADGLREHLDALRARDAARFGATLGSDVTVVDGGGTIARGRDAVLRSHAEWFASSDDWSFDYDVIFSRELGGAGLALIDVTYRQTPSADPARFLLSLLFARDENGAWKFVYDQNTPRASKA